MLIVQGVREYSAYSKEWPELHVGMDDKGYMNPSLFYRWITQWEADTRAVAQGRPRCLFIDNHYSHHVVAAMEFLREHNVRVVGMHPHTTHVLCALDCGIFRSFKSHFERAFTDLVGTFQEKDLPGLIKKAWGAATAMTINPVSGARDSVAIRAFKKVGLYPFNRNVLDEAEYALSQHYKDLKEEREEGDEALVPNPKRPRLTLSDEQIAKYLEDQKKPLEAFPGEVERIRKAGRVQMAQLLTDPETMAKIADAELKKKEEVEKKANQPWTLAGISFRAWQKQKAAAAKEVAEKEKAAKAAAKAAEAAAKAAAAPPPPPMVLPVVAKKAEKKKEVAALPQPPPPPPPKMRVVNSRGRVIKRPNALGV
jgi:hypothetical protein